MTAGDPPLPPPRRRVGAGGLAVGGGGPPYCAGAGMGEHGAPLAQQTGWACSQLSAGAALWRGPSACEAWAVGVREGRQAGVGSRACVLVGRDELCHGVPGATGHLGLFLLSDHALPCRLTQTPLRHAAGGPTVWPGGPKHGQGTESAAGGTRSAAGGTQHGRGDPERGRRLPGLCPPAPARVLQSHEQGALARWPCPRQRHSSPVLCSRGRVSSVLVSWSNVRGRTVGHRHRVRAVGGRVASHVCRGLSPKLGLNTPRPRLGPLGHRRVSQATYSTIGHRGQPGQLGTRRVPRSALLGPLSSV